MYEWVHRSILTSEVFQHCLMSGAHTVHTQHAYQWGDRQSETTFLDLSIGISECDLR